MEKSKIKFQKIRKVYVAIRKRILRQNLAQLTISPCFRAFSPVTYFFVNFPTCQAENSVPNSNSARKKCPEVQPNTGKEVGKCIKITNVRISRKYQSLHVRSCIVSYFFVSGPFLSPKSLPRHKEFYISTQYHLTNCPLW